MSVTKYPKVRDEWATLRKLQEGFSIARFGDGELKMATGKEYVREPANREMAKELLGILQHPHPKCLVRIWPYNRESPKYESMSRHRERFKTVLHPEVEYYSSLISRPDSAPWIRTREYALAFATLWAGKRVAMVCEEGSGAHRALEALPYMLPKHVYWTPCPSHRAYYHIDTWERVIVHESPDIAILACGPTATCLAHRLAKRGIQAIDFGSAGSFLAKLLTDA